MRIQDLKIGTRLGACFAAVLLMMAAQAVISITRITGIGDRSEQLVQEDMVKADAVALIDATTRANARYTMELFMAPDRAYSERLRAKIDGNKQTITDAVAVLDALVRRPEGKALLAQFKTDRAAYVKSFSQVSALLADGRREQASAQLMGSTLPALDALQATIGGLATLQKQIAHDAVTEIGARIAATRLTIILLGVLALAGGAAGAWLITRSVVVPIGTAVTLAEAVAAGDLRTRHQRFARDETGQLLHALHIMSGNLQQIVGRVRGGTETIASASTEIASGNQDLSARTEQQASVLEETASSMEELTSTVRHNADHAREAQRKAQTASEVAARGGAVVSSVVDTMQSIRASSGKVADIISVIDSIAFQTNILALNAAVEAARAGEQGRGFAVVATEVRNLAHRSATAAKEISTLINASVQQVGQGSALVEQAGQTMAEVVASIDSVTAIMADIAAASAEQGQGIEQINQAVTEMDGVTQQNAALVEQAAAAAESMQDQARALAQIVSQFRLDGGDGRDGRSSAPARVALPA
ncbi:chemotaxis protein [Duganella sp. Leaf126]|uniref:methyl-accepting chemotaxis protein n=1 Tax=Duganella sp. Leaf126 TaxID=1736266 RepID=UPI0006F9DEDF|nr:methyl-accepting chemotaxis protein [Duganella sp. Leaf126]KQQ32948.1 chemotaxis protein [Duganella sp. Leaf126]